MTQEVSTPADSTLCGFNQLQVENREEKLHSFQKQTLNLPHAGTHLYNVYIVSGFFLFFCIEYYKNLETIQSTGEDVRVCSSHANTKPFYTKAWSTGGPGCLQGS